MTVLTGSCSAQGNTTVSIDDLREVTIYAEAIEAENAVLKQSLETEREATEELIAAQEELNKAHRAEKRQKNVWLVLLGAAVVGLAVSR